MFKQFSQKPEEFIMKAISIINGQKATTIVEHIEYKKLDSSYDTSIFTDKKIKGAINNSVKTPHKHIYNYVIADSSSMPEKGLAETLEISEEVSVYAKLPRGFCISTPVGDYNPDWAIAFNEGSVKHIYFVAETKGSLDTLTLRTIKKAKIDCAGKHFAAISSDEVKYGVATNYKDLLKIVTGV